MNHGPPKKNSEHCNLVNITSTIDDKTAIDHLVGDRAIT
jgi:hypothetical protein